MRRLPDTRPLLSTAAWLAVFCACLVGVFPPLDAAHAGDHCAVLQYHQISDTAPGIVSVTPRQFQAHLDHLLAGDFAVLALDDVVARLDAGQPLPAKCVALTIDDAFSSAYTEAYPRALRYEFPLTVFVSSAAIDAARDGYLSWEQIREMHHAGVSFQNHSHSHEHLIRRRDDETQDDWEQRVASDIQVAQNRLADEVGERPTLFSYPYGEYNEPLQRIIASMGLVAFGQHSGPVWRQADFTALPRFPMVSLLARMRAFDKKVGSHPLPITGAFPTDPVVALEDWQPSLTLVFRPETAGRERLSCYLNGSPDVVYQWVEQPPNAVVITPRGRLQVGRNRMDCTLPLHGDDEAVGWYSHTWIRRTAGGGWYRDPRHAVMHGEQTGAACCTD